MDAERLDVFRKLLNERLDALTNKMGSRIGQLVDQRETLSDQTDIATEESDRDMVLRLNDHERKMVQQLQHALRRVDDGDYGVCMACGDDISERRLMARPMATHCIDCMTELEASTSARM
ncbi:MAG: TraR/DksA C4-type zinc finger protein [Myxococcales bacterium]|nr:TraR/DksA C4-type zinc finger protein [Myxococcales bacterium]